MENERLIKLVNEVELSIKLTNYYITLLSDEASDIELEITLKIIKNAKQEIENATQEIKSIKEELGLC